MTAFEWLVIAAYGLLWVFPLLDLALSAYEERRTKHNRGAHQ